jgi:membrane protease YdiL (CAAX protease family)
MEKTESRMTADDTNQISKWAVLLEVAVVGGLMIFGFRTLGRAIAHLPGSASVDQFTVFTLGTMGLILVLRRRLDDFGIVFTTVGPSFRLAFRSMAILGPAGMVFLLAQVLGTNPNEWTGSAIVTGAFLLATPLVVALSSGLPTRESARNGSTSVMRVILLLAVAVMVSVWTVAPVPLLSKLLHYALIVGFSEEIFFRGYVQSRLNHGFGRPYRWRGISFGPGLFVAALVFGLAHTLAGNEWLWQRTLFPFAYGIVLGLIREKDGSVLAPAILHGFGDAPRVFFG